ncbi:MAG: DUF547 domain-containing protein [Planctomycetota bacterium]|jgi:hypothetical protein
MAKGITVFIISTFVLLFIIGCSKSAPAETVDNSKTEPPKAEPTKIEPHKSLPVTTAPPQDEVPMDEHSTTETENLESEQVEPEPENKEPAKPETKNVELQKAEPNETETRQPKPLTVAFRDKCADILNNFVDDKGMVKYRALKLKRRKLNSLLREFAKLKPAEYKNWTKEDKIAFWLNAYNIKMLKIITDNYPIKGSKWLLLLWGPNNIRHIERNIDGIKEQKLIVMDEEFTLAEVERRFFHKEFNEPRIFLALSQASLSSPQLRNKPYTGPELYKQLDEQAKNFLSSSRAFVINREKKRVYISAIFDPSWYGKYFIGKYGTDKKFKEQSPSVRAVLNFITNYISEHDISFLQTEYYSVKYINYNWNIND